MLGKIDIPEEVTAENFYQVFECHHARTELRKRTIVNGEARYHRQCVVCGHAGQAVAKRVALEEAAGEEIPPYDEDLPQTFLEWRSRKYNELVIAPKRAKFERYREEDDELYRSYLLTPKWQAIREKVFRRCGRVCEGCLSARATVVHHQTYAHKYDEFLFELVGLCEACHRRFHGIEEEEQCQVG